MSYRRSQRARRELDEYINKYAKTEQWDPEKFRELFENVQNESIEQWQLDPALRELNAQMVGIARGMQAQNGAVIIGGNLLQQQNRQNIDYDKLNRKERRRLMKARR
jgi:hypothetical protein